MAADTILVASTTENIHAFLDNVREERKYYTSIMNIEKTKYMIVGKRTDLNVKLVFGAR